MFTGYMLWSWEEQNIILDDFYVIGRVLFIETCHSVVFALFIVSENETGQLDM
jgi:hypothetical protein